MPKKERLIIQLDQNVKEELRERATSASLLNKRHVSIAEVIRVAINQYLKKEKL